MTITVIVPVYNVAEYLDDCISSIVEQTYTDLEILLVDDGSTDGSSAMCDRWAEKDPRIRAIHKPNGGVSSARNEGILQAGGDYIGFIDADDWIDARMYEKLAAAIDGVDVACCGFVDYPMGTMDKPVPKGLKPVGVCDAAQAIQHIYERDGYLMSSCNKLYSRRAITKDEKTILMDTSIAWGEDELWLMEVITNSKRISFVPEALYHWRPRLSSFTRAEVLNDLHMSRFVSKERAMAITPKPALKLFRAVYFNDCYIMKVMAYCTRDWEKYKAIKNYLSPLKRDWLSSPDPPLVRKLKVYLLDIEMALKMPVTIVRRTDSVRRYGIKE